MALRRATRPLRTAFIASFVVASVMTGGVPAAATPGPPPDTGRDRPTIGYPVHQDVSPALRDIGSVKDDGTSARGKDRKPMDVGHHPAPDNGSPTPASPTSLTAAPTLGRSFEGVGQGFTGPSGTFTVNAAPPDPNGAVGPNHYVETVNTSFAIFNKSGTPVYGPVTIKTLWAGFGGGCQTNNDGDPIVVYDRISDRWVISQFSVSTTPYLQCVAVSQTGDPTGAYYRYSYSYGNSSFPDYPKFGVWPDGYYVTFNIFTGGVSFAGAKACSYDRAKMLVGAAATQVCFNTSTSYGSLLPSTLDGAQLPPSGAPNYMVALGTTTTQLAYWRFHSDFATPANSTFTGPTTLAVSSYSQACGGGTCVPQSGTSQKLDSLGDRLMYRLAYRNFGDHEALVVNHSVTTSGVGVRWYELRVGGGNSLSVYQQGTYAPDANYRWMGSIAMDQAGNIGLGFSLSGTSLKPSIHYTGRLAGDPLGTMAQGEATIIDGTGVQTGSSLSRWGDYTSLAVDPSDDCTFWYTDQYIASNGAFNWHTRIGTFTFSGCGTPPPTNDFSISATPSSLSIQQGNSGTSTISTAVTNGAAETVTLSASGLPANATASFNPASVTAGGSSTLTISTSTSTPAGSSTVTVTGTAPSATHSTSIALTVTAPAGSDPIVNGGFETGSLSGWTAAGSTAISTTPHSGTYSARIGSPSPFSGDSSVAQTFTVPSGLSQLSFWYRVVCTDTVTYDWATATLRDNTTGVTTTVLAKTCSNTGTWSQKTAAVTVGHSYTLTLIDHDDNYPGDPTYTLYDDVTVH